MARTSLAHRPVSGGSFGKRHVIPRALTGLGRLLFEQRRFAEAEALYRDAFEDPDAQIDLPRFAPLRASWHLHLAFVLRKQGRLMQAEETALAAYRLLKSIPAAEPDRKSLLSAALETLVLVEDALGAGKEAARYKEELSTLAH
jgi:tetratricopeptide (TPR) repeat protein